MSRNQNQNQNRLQQSSNTTHSAQPLLSKLKRLQEEQLRLSLEEQSVYEQLEMLDALEHQQLERLNQDEQRRTIEQKNMQQNHSLLRTGLTVAAIFAARGSCTASMNYAATQHMHMMEQHQLCREMENARLKIFIDSQNKKARLLTSLQHLQNKVRWVEYDIQSTQTELSVFHLPVPLAHPVCSQCGHTGEAGAKFCGNCGIQLQPSPQVCSQCGCTGKPGAKFCKDCGTQLQPSAPSLTQAPMPAVAPTQVP